MDVSEPTFERLMWTSTSPRPVTSTYPSSQFWGFKQSISYGDKVSSAQMVMPPTSGVIDSTTVMTLLPTSKSLLSVVMSKPLTNTIYPDVFNNYIMNIGATYDEAADLYYLLPDGYANLKSLFFITGGITLEFVANAQVWPVSMFSLSWGRAELFSLT